MVRFTIWSSHSPQTLLMLYHRMDGMISIAGFVIGKAKSSAVNCVLGFIMLSVWNWQPNQRGIGFAQNVRLVWNEGWISVLVLRFKQLFLCSEMFLVYSYIASWSRYQKNLYRRGFCGSASPLFSLCVTWVVFAFLPWVFNFLCVSSSREAPFQRVISSSCTSNSENILHFSVAWLVLLLVGWSAFQQCRKKCTVGST